MERRCEPRTPAWEPATLKVLGRETAGVIQAMLEECSPRGIRLRTPVPVPGNVPVEVETDGVLILGDVCRCTPNVEAGGGYSVAVRVAHRLSLLKQLHSLQQNLLQQNLKDRLPQEPARTRA